MEIKEVSLDASFIVPSSIVLSSEALQQDFATLKMNAYDA